MKFKSILTASVFALAMMGTLPVLTGCEDSEKEEKLTTVEASGRFATKLLMDIGNGKLLHQEIPFDGGDDFSRNRHDGETAVQRIQRGRAAG